MINMIEPGARVGSRTSLCTGSIRASANTESTKESGVVLVPTWYCESATWLSLISAVQDCCLPRLCLYTGNEHRHSLGTIVVKIPSEFAL